MSGPRQRADVTVLLNTEHAVASVLNSAMGERDARPRLLEAIGDVLGWHVGAYWEPQEGLSLIHI